MIRSTAHRRSTARSRCIARQPQRAVQGLISTVVLSLAAGCALVRLPETEINPADALRESYASAAISYRVDARQPAAAPPIAAEGQLVSYLQPSSVAAPQSPPSPRSPGAKIQTLSIKYPHPHGRKGYARAELIIQSADAAGAEAKPERGGWLGGLKRAANEYLPGLNYGDGISSAWALDIPIGDVDSVIDGLEAQGYFSETDSPVQDVDLGASINGLAFQKRWHDVSELDALIVRIRREGRLVSHRQPITPARSRTTAPSVQLAAPSVQAASPALQTASAELYPIGIERLPPVE